MRRSGPQSCIARTARDTVHADRRRTNARLDSLVKQDVAFVKIDVEGHELRVLNSASGLLGRSRPVFLVESEERIVRRPASVFEFFAGGATGASLSVDDSSARVIRSEPEASRTPTPAPMADARRGASTSITSFSSLETDGGRLSRPRGTRFVALKTSCVPARQQSDHKGANAHCNDRRRLCRPGFRRLSCRFRARGDLRRQ